MASPLYGTLYIKAKQGASKHGVCRLTWVVDGSIRWRFDLRLHHLLYVLCSIDCTKIDWRMESTLCCHSKTSQNLLILTNHFKLKIISSPKSSCFQVRHKQIHVEANIIIPSIILTVTSNSSTLSSTIRHVRAKLRTYPAFSII
jgi:hypothetical protein